METKPIASALVARQCRVNLQYTVDVSVRVMPTGRLLLPTIGELAPARVPAAMSSIISELEISVGMSSEMSERTIDVDVSSSHSSAMSSGSGSSLSN